MEIIDKKTLRQIAKLEYDIKELERKTAEKREKLFWLKNRDKVFC